MSRPRVIVDGACLVGLGSVIPVSGAVFSEAVIRRGLRYVDELSDKVREQLALAYSAKDGAPEQSLRRLREVLAMTPAGDELHRKAAEWIEKLSR